MLMLVPRRAGRLIGLAIALAALAPLARGQFSGPTTGSEFVERLTGEVQSAEGQPTPEPGDQVAVVFQDLVLGVFTFTTSQTNPREYDVLVFGDDPDTEEVEGPRVGQSVSFRFYDQSTNTVRTDIAGVNAQGEVLNVTFQGDFTFEIPINIPGAPPFPDAPSREIDLRLGVQAPGDGGDGGDGDGETPMGDPDVDGDGEITTRDAALVLRVVVGGRVDSSTVARADVNNDGVVNTLDAREVIRARR